MADSNRAVVAKELFILLGKELRISRNIRMEWYFDNLNTMLSLSPRLDRDLDSLEVVSAVLEDETIKNVSECFIGSDTRLTFLSSRYRFVFALDLTASMLRVDTFQQCTMLDAILFNLEECLVSLIQPYTIEGTFSGEPIVPAVFVTVFAQWHGTYNIKCSDSMETINQKVLVQGCHLTVESIRKILDIVKQNIYDTQKIAEVVTKKTTLPRQDDILIGMLRTALLGIRLLPTNSNSSIVIITDGVIGEPESSMLIRLLNQCHYSTVSCSFIHVNPSDVALCDFGYISNTKLMIFVADSTKGKYINSFTIPYEETTNMNYYQRCFLQWSFHQETSAPKQSVIDLNKFRNICSTIELNNITGQKMEPPVLLTLKQDERTLRISLLTVVNSRIREGYEVKRVKIYNSIIEIVMVLPWWKNCTFIEYRVSSAWPLGKKLCKVEVNITGSYEFLLDVSKRNEGSKWSKQRRMVLQRLLYFLQDLTQGDHMLYYLNTFSNEPSRYKVTSILQQGQSLYYMSSNSEDYIIATQAAHTSVSFSSYWKPILSLDVTLWQKWLHIHRIEIILNHDTPLPPNLHMQSSKGRYSVVQSRLALSQLTTMLKDWCSFVLLEYQTYVKFIYGPENNEIPLSYLLVRLSNKTPALVIKIAFLVGISGDIRKKYVDELRKNVASLVFKSSSNINKIRHASSRQSPIPRSRYASSNEKTCVVLMHKPVDQILVKYPVIPRDFLNTLPISDYRFHSKSRSETNDPMLRLRDMKWYLDHHRFVWSLTNAACTPLSMDTAASVANMLLKIKLNEGFHIAHSSSGFINVMKEFLMFPDSNADVQHCERNNICLVQYLLFPPTLCSLESSVSSNESDDDESADSGQKEIQLAVEVWVEPQEGMAQQSHVFNHSAGSASTMYCDADFMTESYYSGITYDEIPNVIVKNDTRCISSVVTLEHLLLMCSSDTVLTFPQKSDMLPALPKTPINDADGFNYDETQQDFESTFSRPFSNGVRISEEINHFPCVFNLADLLQQSSRVKLLFMTLHEDKRASDSPNDILFQSFYKSIEKFCDCDVELSDDDQADITFHLTPKTSEENNITATGTPWSCFLAHGDQGQVFVVIMPSTYQDFLDTFSAEVDEQPRDDLKGAEPNVAGTKLNERNEEKIDCPTVNYDDGTFDASTPASKTFRRISIKRFPSTFSENTPIINIKKRTLPIYVYNCSMQSIVSGFLENQSGCMFKWPDSVRDYRHHADSFDIETNHDHNHQLLSPRREKPELKSFTSKNSDVSDDVFSLGNNLQTGKLSSFCKVIADLYHHSFAVGVFSGIRAKNTSLSMDDLQIVTDYVCNEYVQEIDITDFMLLNCPQVNEFKSSHLNNVLPENLATNFTDPLFESEDIEDICSPSNQQSPSLIPIDNKLNPTLLQMEAQPLPDKTSALITLAQSKTNSVEIHKKPSSITRLQEISSSPQMPLGGKSAFAYVHSRHSHNHRAPESENNSKHKGSESTDEEENQTIRQPLKKITTLPVKRIDNRKLHSICLQSGWTDLPEFPLAKLNVEHQRHISGSNDQIEKHFCAFVKKFCQPVPSLPDLHYSVTLPFLTQRDISLSNFKIPQETDLEEIQFENVDNTTPENTKGDKKAQVNSLPKIFSSSGQASDNEDPHSDKEVTPLFLCMACTVRDKSGNHGSMPVTTLPVNLKTVLSYFDKPCSTVKLADIKITLDLIWIYLPSFTLDGSVSNDIPNNCLPCVNGVTKKIKWFLEDEIISSLRSCEPITSSTLEKVSSHIKTSQSSNCIVRCVKLQFIYGAEKSKSLFEEEFEKKRLSNYKLKKEGNFYYLGLETTFKPINEDIIDSHVVNPQKNRGQGDFQPTKCSPMNVPAIETENSNDPQSQNSKNAIKKASSSVELSNTMLLSRRSSSVSSMLSDRRLGYPNNTTPSPLNLSNLPTHMKNFASPNYNHPALKYSHSCGREVEGHAHLNASKGSGTSMPVTPLGLDYSKADDVSTQFSFSSIPTNICEDFSVYNPEQGISPQSDHSHRNYSYTSWIGSGYDGEASDDFEEGEEFLFSMQDANSQLPNFWLIVSTTDECATILFHRRVSTKVSFSMQNAHKTIIENLCENLCSSCKAANQMLLLKKLHASRLCHSLLVEKPHDTIWNKDENSLYQTPDYEQVDQNDQSGDYLAANMNLPSGYFECKCIFTEEILLHHRICGTPLMGSTSALSTVRNLLKNFAVINQKNMFVFQGGNSLSIYYCRIKEHIRKQDGSGRRSARFQKQSSSEQLHGSTVSLSASRDNVSSVMSKLILEWHGVHELVEEERSYLNEIRDTIKRKLDDTVLETISLMLSRNPLFKLTAEDVSLIQPRVNTSAKAPDDTITYRLPSDLVAGKKRLSTFVYYLHQHLLKEFTVPRYTEPTVSFQSYPRTTNVAAQDYSPNNMYIYNSQTAKGSHGIGIACICVETLPGIIPGNCLTINEQTPIEELIKVTTVDPDLEDKQLPVVHFHIWKPEAMIIAFQDNLKLAVHHALCDAVMELLLRIPCSAPVEIKKTPTMRKLFQSSSDVSSKESEKESDSSDLNQVYQSLLLKWVEHMLSVSCPTVCVLPLDCLSYTTLHQSLFNMVKIVEDSLPGSTVLQYIKTHFAPTWKELDTKRLFVNRIPGLYPDFLLISRNFQLWKKIISPANAALKVDPSAVSIQKLAPYDASLNPEISPSPQHSLITSSTYIPRQHFTYLRNDKKSLKIYCYNLNNEKLKSFQNQLAKCVHFHNARYKMVQDVTFQKLGLFNHSNFKPKGKIVDTNGQPYSMECLTKCTTIDKIDKFRKRNAKPYLYFVDTYLDNVPVKPILTPTVSDLATKFGDQTVSVARQKSFINNDKLVLKNICAANPSAMPYSVSSNTLTIMLSYSRFLHSVSAPILFNKSANDLASRYQIFNPNTKNELESSKLSFLSRTSSVLQSYRRRSGDASNKSVLDTLPVDHNSSAIDINKYWNMASEAYKHLWVGFAELKVNSVSSTGKLSKNEKDLNPKKCCLQPLYLYRVMTGGIFMVKLILKNNQLKAILHLIDNCHYSDHATVTKKGHHNFLNDNKKFKERLRIHEFALESQLKFIQITLQDSPSLIAKLNLVDLFEKILSCYSPFIDKLSNHLVKGLVQVPCCNVSDMELFNFILENAMNLDVQTCEMSTNSFTTERIIYSLSALSNQHNEDCNVQEHDNHSISLVVAYSDDNSKDTLSLNYFITFTRKPSPISSMLKASPKHSPFKRRFSEASSNIMSFLSHPTIELSDTDDESRSKFTPCEIERTEAGLKRICESAETECFRIHLWKRLALTCQDKSSASIINITEFSKLLEHMHVFPTQDLDNNIGNLLTKKRFRILQKRLLKKFPKSSHDFISADNATHRVCILSQTNHVLVTLDSSADDVQMLAAVPHSSNIEFTKDKVHQALQDLVSSVHNEICVDTWLSWLKM